MASATGCFKAGRMTGSARLRIGMAGCGRARRLHVDRLQVLVKVGFAGCAGPDRGCAESLADGIRPTPVSEKPSVLSGHLTFGPNDPFIFTPHFGHYRPAIDAFQTGCHVFIEKPLATNVQEAADIVVMAPGRQSKVRMGHPYRPTLNLSETCRHFKTRAVGKFDVVTALIARRWTNASEQSSLEILYPQPSAEPRFTALPRRGARRSGKLMDAMIWACGNRRDHSFRMTVISSVSTPGN
ncbi:MAG: Gfo/Idh/MocA family oxidoreductase [Isosphaeraceae bacterium]